MLAIAKAALLNPTALSEADLEGLLGHAMGPGIDSADLYFQFARSESWMLEDGIVKEGSHSIEQGVGVRAVAGDRQALAYSDDLNLSAIADAAKAVRALSRDGAAGARVKLQARSAPALYSSNDPIDTLDAPAKITLLKEIDAFARSLDPRVKQVIVSIAGSHEVISVSYTHLTLPTNREV